MRSGMAGRDIYTPEFANLKFTIAEAKKLDQILQQIQDLDQVQLRELKEKLAEVRLAQAKEELDRISVDQLSEADSGIRVSALKKAGIDTIGKIADYSEYDYKQIPGIGDDSAPRIKRAVEGFIRSMAGLTSVRLN